MAFASSNVIAPTSCFGTRGGSVSAAALNGTNRQRSAWPSAIRSTSRMCFTIDGDATFAFSLRNLCTSCAESVASGRLPSPGMRCVYTMPL